MTPAYKVFLNSAQKAHYATFKYITNVFHNAMDVMFLFFIVALAICAIIGAEFIFLLGGIIMAIIVLPMLLLLCPLSVFKHNPMSC